MDKTKIIDYLYGEMNAEEEKAFTEQLKADNELRNELESLKNMRGFLTDHEDEIPQGQPIVIPNVKRTLIGRRWWAIAASIAVLLIGAKLLDLRVSIGDNQFTLQFGETENKNLEIQAESQLKLNELAFSIDLLKVDLLEQLGNYDSQFKNSESKISNYQQQMASLINNLKADQSKLTLDLWDQFKNDQKQHTELLVDDFVEYVDAQRQQDLQLINESMNNLAQLIQLETDQRAQYVYQPIQK